MTSALYHTHVMARVPDRSELIFVEILGVFSTAVALLSRYFEGDFLNEWAQGAMNTKGNWHITHAC